MRRGLSRHNNRSSGSVVAAFTPLSLFADGSQGVWYDDSNMATMYQDSAGTTPVTAVEQPVGKQLDLSGNNNHRTQTTSANRPTLSARYNLLTKTEDFSNATAWGGTAITRTTNTITETATTNIHQLASATYANPANVSTIFSIEVKPNGRNYVTISWANSGSHFAAFYLSGAGSIISNQLNGIGAIQLLSDGYYKITFTNTPTISGAEFYGVNLANAAYPSNPTPSYLGDGVSGVFVRNADLRPANQATGLIPTYQRVDTSSVYDTVGFPQYLKYNGSNSSLSTASINFTATAQAAYFAGLRKLATTTSVFTELSATVGSNNGSFAIFAGLDTTTDYAFYLRGTSGVYYAPSSYTPPITNTLSSQFNLAGASKATAIIPTVNNVTVQTGGAGTTAGTGNFGTYPFYFGARAGSGLFFNGYEYQTIIVGKTLTATEISNTETYVNSKTLAY